MRERERERERARARERERGLEVLGRENERESWALPRDSRGSTILKKKCFFILFFC